MRERMSDFALGFRLAVGGSRNHATSLVRLGVGAFGIALAVAVLLGAASAGTVVEERDARQAAQLPDTEPREGVSPTLVRNTGVDFRGQYIGATFIQHTDETSPIPVGVPRQLKPGEVVVSAALADLLVEPDSGQLRKRFDDYRIVGELAPEGVVQRLDLRFVAGSDSLADAVGEQQHYIAQAYGFGWPVPPTQVPPPLLMLMVLGVVVLIVPLLIFVQASSRIAGAERDRRLAAIRLVGADTSQARRVAAAEALVPAVVGLLLGAGLFLLLRPLADQVEFFGVSIYADDIVPSWWGGALIVLGVPVLAVATSLVALRRTVVEPLGVVRHGRPVRTRRWWWRVGMIPAGVAILLFSGPVVDDIDVLFGVGLGASLLILGVASILAWAIELVIRRVRGGSPSVQLAARRLQLDAGTAARVIAGVVVVLTGAIALLTVMTSLFQHAATHSAPEQGAVGGPDGLAPASPGVQMIVSSPDELAGIVARLGDVDRVNGVHPTFDPVIEDRGKGAGMLVGDCFALRQVAPLPECAEGDVFLPESARLDVAPGDRLALDEASWRIPDDARKVAFNNGAHAVLATPAAVPESAANPQGRARIVLDADLPDAAIAAEFAENVRGLFDIERDVWVDTPYLTTTLSDMEQQLEQIRSWILAGAVIVLALATLSVLVLAVEQVRERQRSLAAVSAGGIGFGTLARSLLWQNAIAFGTGAVLALGGGVLVAALVLRIADVGLVMDWTSVGLLLAASVALMLIVTALSLPMLRAAVSVRNLRTE